MPRVKRGVTAPATKKFSPLPKVFAVAAVTSSGSLKKR